MNVEKPKAPPGRSYPLQSSMLEPLLEGLPEDLGVILRYDVWKETPRRVVLEANYWMPNDRVPQRRLYLCAGDFPSSDRKRLAAFLVEEAIPALCRWTKYLNSLPDNSTALMQKPLFQAFVENDNVYVSCRPSPM